MDTSTLHYTPTNYTDYWRMSPHSLQLDFIPTAIVDLFPKISTDRFPKLDNYLRSRGISEKTYRKFDVRASEQGELVFLFKNLLGNTLGIVFRNTIEKRIRGLKLELLELQGIKLPKKARAGAWFGINLVDITKPLIIVEGEIDCMHIYEFMEGRRINIISPGGMSVTKQQMRAIYNKEIYLGFDADAAGEQGSKQFIKMAPKDKIIWKLNWSIVGCKDPGELSSPSAYFEVLRNKVRIA